MARATSPAEPGTIERLAEWVLAVRAEHIADRTALQAKLLLLDTIGCGIAARDDECARAVLATVDALGGRRNARSSATRARPACPTRCSPTAR